MGGGHWKPKAPEGRFVRGRGGELSKMGEKERERGRGKREERERDRESES